MFKRTLMLTMSLAALLSCQQAAPVADEPATKPTAPSAADKPKNYVALPGQAATSATPSETLTAFEYAAAAYANQAAEPAPSPGGDATPPASAAPAAPIPEPRAIETPITAAPSSESAAGATAASISAAPPTPQRSVAQSAASGAPYAVQVTNGTSGRLFIEVQDDGGNIFPFGFMHAGQRIGSQPQEPRAIQGQLIVVVRDPDRPGAPELRRYRVTPPAAYEGKTVGVTILPGGQYRASLDGEIYYTSPPPAETPAE